MRRLHLFLLLFLTMSSVNSQGFNFSTQEELDGYRQLTKETFGFSTDIPSSYSFENYVPSVVEQQGGTCVGYAMLYYGLSTMYNIEFGITSPKAKLAHAFDPYFIYSIINNNKENPCDIGLNMTEATNALQSLGAKKLLYPPFLGCGTSWTRPELLNVLDYTLPYAINDFLSIDMNQSNLIKLAKGALYDGIPIISGFILTESFNQKSSSFPNGVDNSGLWDPNQFEESIGGHAMTLVGYDDYKYGGAFRVVNSWGTDYGDNGYLWVKYSDWLTYAEESYIIELNQNLVNNSIDYSLYEDEYVRFDKNYGSYEGQTSSLYSLDGFGILYYKEDDTFYIGKYNQNEMDGYFLYVDSDGLFSTNILDGEFQKINRLGFASGPNFEKKNDSINTYLENIGIKYKIRKANSTKNISTKIEN